MLDLSLLRALLSSPHHHLLQQHHHRRSVHTGVKSGMASPGECLVAPLRSSFVYLNEGAANIVYRIFVPPGTPPPSSIEEYYEGEPVLSDEELLELSYGPFDNKLLRVRKDLPTTVPCAIAQRDWLEHIRPLFEKHEVVEQCLVQIRDAKIVERLNEELKGWERPYPMKGSLRGPSDHRPTKRNGIYLADDEHGLLVTDMTPGDDDGTMEFKPKWLAQSPSAPETAIRCRQCAREARKNAQLAAKGERLARTACVLDLVSDNPADLLAISYNLLLSSGSAASPASDFQVRRFARWLGEDNLLRRLRDHQTSHDVEGPLAADVESVPFRVAMTLRDCTVFIRWPKKENGKVEARIGDLDLKSPEKKKYWQDTERELIDEGWYDGTESQKDWQPLNCRMNPNRYKFGGGRPTPTV